MRSWTMLSLRLAGILLTYSLWQVECTVAYRRPRGERIHNRDPRLRQRILMKDDKGPVSPSPTFSPSTTPSAQPVSPPSEKPLILLAADPVLNPSSSFLVELQDFMVLMSEVHSANLTMFFDKVITGELVKEFESLISVEIHESKSYKEGFSKNFHFSGTAIFGLPVSIKDVLYAQARVLQDLKSLQNLLPNVISIAVIPTKPIPDGNAEESADHSISPALVSAVMAFVACIVGITILLGYRHYKSYQMMLEKSNNQSVSRTTVSNPELSIPREIHQFDVMSRSALSCSQIEGDEFSLADFNTTYSEVESEFHQIQGDHQCRVKEVDTSLNGSSSNEMNDELYTDILQYKEKKTNSSSPLSSAAVSKSHNYDTVQFSSRIGRNPGLESDDDDEDVYTTSNKGNIRHDNERSSTDFIDDGNNIVYFGKSTSSTHIFREQNPGDNICRRENGSLVGNTPFSLSNTNLTIEVDPLEIENQRSFRNTLEGAPISTTLNQPPRPKESLNNSLSLLKRGIATKLAQYKR